MKNRLRKPTTNNWDKTTNDDNDDDELNFFC